MKYQKARYLPKDETFPGFWGKMVWVKEQPPTRRLVQDLFEGGAAFEESYELGFSSPFTGRPCVVRKQDMELLSEFTDENLHPTAEVWLQEQCGMSVEEFKQAVRAWFAEN